MTKRTDFLRIVILSLLFIGTGLAQHVNYDIRFGSKPREIIYENNTALEFKVDFGGFPLKPCNFSLNCSPPPVGFAVVIKWRNPNDIFGDPNCWIPVFIAGAFYGPEFNDIWIVDSTLALGSIELLNPDEYGTPGCCCCYYPLRCNGGTWSVKAWPLFSGEYKIELIDFEAPEFDMCVWCYDDDYYPPWWKWCDWGPGVPRSVGIEYLKVNRDVRDVNFINSLFFISTDEQDTVTDYETFKLLEEYKVACKIVTTKRIEDIPTEIRGYLHTEDDLIPTQITFCRWPEADYVLPCQQNPPVRLYGYKTNQSFTPPDLFPQIPPEEWSNITKHIGSYILGDDNGMSNDRYVTGIVMSGLQLDCTNDSTVCFIPAAEEKMNFIFRYGRDMGFDETTDIRFRVRKSDEAGEPSEVVYEEHILIRDINIDPNEWGLPGVPMPDSMKITWDGRMNTGAGSGHLANPHNDPFRAIVEVFPPDDPDNPILSSNTEEFDAVPWIDSVLVTHTPWFPPPAASFEQEIDIYSLARGKIDNSGNPAVDYVYYHPEGEEFPFRLGFWDGNTHRYWDLSPNVWGVVNYYSYLDHWVPSPVFEWNSVNWGALTYRWYEVFDYAEKREVEGRKRQFLYYTEVDQTQAWGTNWHTTISRYVDWRDRSIFHVPPRMRFGARSRISDLVAGYEIQDQISSEAAAAHQIILGRGGNPNGWDNFDWAVSHIGTPYYYPDDVRPTKKPYTYVECSGLVVASRIQEIDSWNNNCYRINNNNVQHLVDGFYYYPPPPQGQPPNPEDMVDLHIDPVDAEVMEKGSLIAMRDIRGDNVFDHVVIVEWIDFNADYQRIAHCYGIHARGSEKLELRRVRYDNFLSPTYRPEDQGGIYEYQFLDFVGQ